MVIELPEMHENANREVGGMNSSGSLSGYLHLYTPRNTLFCVGRARRRDLDTAMISKSQIPQM